MPFVLIIAFAASLGVHGLVLFGPEFDLSLASDPPPLVVELPPPAKALPPVELPAKPATQAVATKRRPLARKASPSGRRPPVLSAPDSSSAPAEPSPGSAGALPADGEPVAESDGERGGAPTEAAPSVPSTASSRLPAKGTIRYRIDRGDQGFQIGYSIHEWEVVDGSYRITAVTETSGLVWLFKPLRLEVESRGRMTAGGLVPERFVTRQKGRETSEQADFDWEKGLLRMPNRPEQALLPGAQDLLSFNYQLGLITDLVSGSSLSIVTGKKYSSYRIEVLGDEQVETPAGVFRCLHLRVPGVPMTEIWLAYDRSLLPVKIQHTDRKGDLFVQIATAIDLTQEP